MRRLILLILLATCFMSLATSVRASWTLAVLPDTQKYKDTATWPIFEAQTQWLVDNKDSLGIEMVLHGGDITDDNVPEQWVEAKSAMSTLDGELPYILTFGNHDIWPIPPFDRSQTMLNDYFALSDNPLNSIVTERITGDLANTYSRFVAPDGRKMLVFSLEFLPRTTIMDWAGSVADLYPDHTAVVLTHANLEEGPAVDGEPTSNRFDVNDGDKLWNGLTGQHGNIEMVLNGHHLDADGTDPHGQLTTARQVSLGVNGNSVNEIAFNSQQQPNGGNGYLRLMEFMDDGSTVQVRTYSPTLDLWLTSDRNEFQVTLTPLDPLLVWQNNYGMTPLDPLLVWQNNYGMTPLDPLLVWQNNYGMTMDGLDFLAWQRDFSSAAENDGITTDGLDFLAWQREFSSAAEVAFPAVSVPEPSSVSLAILIVAILGSTRSSRGQRKALR